MADVEAVLISHGTYYCISMSDQVVHSLVEVVPAKVLAAIRANGMVLDDMLRDPEWCVAPTVLSHCAARC